MSTAKPNPDSRDNRKVIYVYTKDWADEADVMRVREKEAARFAGAQIGKRIHFLRGDWEIVGVMDAGHRAQAERLEQPRPGRDQDHIFLSSQVFVQDFAEALAVFLHEHAHIFGYDGSRAFTDALTQIIESVVRSRHELDSFEQGWGNAKAAVLHERKDSGTISETATVEDTLRNMNEDQLRKLLKRVPEVTFRRALKDTTDYISS